MDASQVSIMAHLRHLFLLFSLQCMLSLSLQQDAGQPITTTMLNVLTRAIARSSDTTTVGKVFNAYEPTWGLQPDVDTYNAVLEACESAGKVGAVQVRGTPTPIF